MKKIFSQKIILTMLVGLFLGGCSLDIRKPFYIGDIVKKKFIDNFEDGEKYGLIYTYREEEKALVSYNAVKYTYDDNGDMITKTGTFGETLRATVTDGIITITGAPYLDYFADGERYLADNGEFYTYIINNGTSYLGGYKFNNAVSYTIGTFGKFDYEGYGTVLTVTIVNGIPTVSADTSVRPFITYFVSGMTYNSLFPYYYNDGSPYIVYCGTRYTFNENSVTTSGTKMTGTFGSLDINGFGVILTGTVDALGVVTIEITTDNRP